MARGHDRVVVADVLCVREDERVAQQCERLAQGLVLTGELARPDQVGGVEDDPQVLGSQLVQQPPAGGGVADDVVVLRLEREDDVVALGHRERGGDLLDAVSPGVRRRRCRDARATCPRGRVSRCRA